MAGLLLAGAGMFDFVQNPVYLLMPLAIGFFTDGPLRLWLAGIFVVSPLLLWMGAAGSVSLSLDDQVIPLMVLTAALIGAGALLSHLKRKAKAQ